MIILLHENSKHMFDRCGVMRVCRLNLDTCRRSLLLLTMDAERMKSVTSSATFGIESVWFLACSILESDTRSGEEATRESMNDGSLHK